MADPLAQACAEGRKTVTRRPMAAITEFQPSPLKNHAWRFRDKNGHIEDVFFDWLGREDFAENGWTRIPGAGTATIGRRVWVRECFQVWTTPGYEYPDEVDLVEGKLPKDGGDYGWTAGRNCHYRANFKHPDNDYPWRPSIHMPKWAARTWGTLTSVTPCDLSDIDDAEAQREGFDTAAEFLRVVAELYPGVRWFWRLEVEWDGKGVKP